MGSVQIESLYVNSSAQTVCVSICVLGDGVQYLVEVSVMSLHDRTFPHYTVTITFGIGVNRVYDGQHAPFVFLK